MDWAEYSDTYNTNTLSMRCQICLSPCAQFSSSTTDAGVAAPLRSSFHARPKHRAGLLCEPITKKSRRACRVCTSFALMERLSYWHGSSFYNLAHQLKVMMVVHANVNSRRGYYVEVIATCASVHTVLQLMVK